MAAAALTARSEIALLRHSAKLESLRDVLGDRILHPMHILLGVQEAAGHRIAQEGFAFALKFGDLLVRKLAAGLLLVLEIFALFAERLVLAPNFFVAQKRIEPLADLLELRLFNNGSAEFPRFLKDNALFGVHLHSLSFVLVWLDARR